jgi:pilus assembly protein Flp/PilA
MSALSFLRTWLRRRDDDTGASLVEYALLVSLIAVVCLVAVAGIGVDVNDRFVGLSEQLNS